MNYELSSESRRRRHAGTGQGGPEFPELAWQAGRAAAGSITQNEPNPAWLGHSRAPGAKAAKRTQFPSRSTKTRGARGAKQSQSAGGLCKTKPISRRCPVGRGLGDEDRGGQSCKTKLICPRCPEMGTPVDMRPPVGPDCAKRSQFCPGTGGKAIAKAAGLDAGVLQCGVFAFGGPLPPVRRGNCAKRSQFRPAAPGGMGPPGHGTRGKCAKRTQFPAVPGGPGPQRLGTQGKCAKRSQFGPAPVERGGDGQGGKCRRRAQACKTNPIPRGRAEAVEVEFATMRRPHPV
jgi:hypothetical protein